jgi:hypothetical protein
LKEGHLQVWKEGICIFVWNSKLTFKT